MIFTTNMMYSVHNSHLLILLVVCVPFTLGQECLRDSTISGCGYAERERTFVMIKPDGAQRGLLGDIISRFERKGLKLVALKFRWANDATLKAHYREHEGKPFYSFLIDYIGSGPVVPMVWEGTNAVKAARTLLGSTTPSESPPGTIRGDLALDAGRNLVHASDSVESAEREIGLWFKEEEIVKWGRNNDFWVYQG